MKQNRNFQIIPAVRKSVPLLIGLFGASGSGKTFSALRLAHGIQRVCPGDILFIDSENNRALHYADSFTFSHIPFDPPFGSLDYLEVLEFAASKKPSCVVIDSFSHEHEGIGGHNDLHEKELDRIAGTDWQKRDRVKMFAWAKPKAARRTLLNGLLRLNVNIIFCFRAKETSKPIKNKDGKTEVAQMGFMPITGQEFPFEMTINCLLPPHSDGYPKWNSQQRGENMMMKLPHQFKNIFDKPDVQLNEDIGERLAIWAKGDEVDNRSSQGSEESREKEATLSALEAYLNTDILSEERKNKVSHAIDNPGSYTLKILKGFLHICKELELDIATGSGEA